MPPVLLYHKIDFPTPDVKIRGAYTSPRRFEKQMSYLKKHGFVFYTASEMVEYYRDHERFPKKGITLTFDDGWKDNFTNAFPVLQRLDIKATIFLVASCIGQTTAKVTAEGEGVREHLAETDIREMARFGVEFGSHSMNHKLFHQITPTEIETEVEESKDIIENLIQKPCSVFAYPAGFFTETAQDAVRKAGYTGAFSTIYGPSENIDIYALNREEILRRDRLPFKFSRKIKSIFSAES